MEMLMAFVISNWQNILVIAVFVVASVYLWVKGYKSNIYAVCLILVNQAEAKFGSGTGGIKYQWVAKHLYTKLPKIITLLFSANEIDDMIENAVNEMKEFLENKVDVTREK